MIDLNDPVMQQVADSPGSIFLMHELVFGHLGSMEDEKREAVAAAICAAWRRGITYGEWFAAVPRATGVVQ